MPGEPRREVSADAGRGGFARRASRGHQEASDRNADGESQLAGRTLSVRLRREGPRSAGASAQFENRVALQGRPRTRRLRAEPGPRRRVGSPPRKIALATVWVLQSDSY